MYYLRLDTTASPSFPNDKQTNNSKGGKILCPLFLSSFSLMGLLKIFIRAVIFFFVTVVKYLLVFPFKSAYAYGL